MDHTDYKFNVVEKYKDSLSRQIAEAVRIERGLDLGIRDKPNGKSVEIVSLNRKSEHFSPRERWVPDKL